MVDRTLRRIFILSGIVLLLWVLYLLKPVVIPFVVAFFMAYYLAHWLNNFAKSVCHVGYLSVWFLLGLASR